LSDNIKYFYSIDASICAFFMMHVFGQSGHNN